MKKTTGIVAALAAAVLVIPTAAFAVSGASGVEPQAGTAADSASACVKYVDADSDGVCDNLGTAECPSDCALG